MDILCCRQMAIYYFNILLLLITINPTVVFIILQGHQAMRVLITTIISVFLFFVFWLAYLGGFSFLLLLNFVSQTISLCLVYWWSFFYLFSSSVILSYIFIVIFLSHDILLHESEQTKCWNFKVTLNISIYLNKHSGQEVVYIVCALKDGYSFILDK